MFTTDRTEFIGRNGTLRNPEAMSRASFPEKQERRLIPCAAIQVVFDLETEEEHEIVFRLGTLREHEGNSNDDPRCIKERHLHMMHLDKVKKYWQHTLGVLQIETPDAALNIIFQWLAQYQTLACRIWARSGFYQSGGGFGFRDQLQDVLSLMYSRPAIAHKQILLNASRQLKKETHNIGGIRQPEEEYVQPVSDDFLWLPFVTLKYVSHTGDTGILDESVSF